MAHKNSIINKLTFKSTNRNYHNYHKQCSSNYLILHSSHKHHKNYCDAFFNLERIKKYKIRVEKELEDEKKEEFRIKYWKR